jgi:hypothetical protein
MRITRDLAPQGLHQHVYHLTYCTNIHPGENWAAVFANLQTYIPPLKAQLAPNDPFGIGLRLANQASEELLTGTNLAQLQAWLHAESAYVFTLNGFPYGGFHHQVVKDAVYAPDWSSRDRVTYTQRLIQILAALLPAGMDGGISTVPLSYKPWCASDLAQRTQILATSSQHLAAIAAELAQLEDQTGQLLHLDLEPEPDALLENADEVIAFFQECLLPIGQKYLQQTQGISTHQAEQWLRKHIQICYDTCHFAVEFEDPAIAIGKFQQAGIAIGKFQLSSALKIPLSSNREQRQFLSEQLKPFAESTYLHQVIEQQASQELKHYRDLSMALPALLETSAQEWRTHFHVPIFIDHYPPFDSTQDHLVAILQQLTQVPNCTHLEIETYTWDVLPPDLKLDVLTSIQREYEWVLATMKPEALTC